MNQPSSKTILCVDDEEWMLASLQRLLHKEPYHLLTARNGEEALSYAIKGHPDLIILDVHMPKMGGYEFLRQLRKAGIEDLPVVMLTGEGSDQAMMKGYREGCLYFIPKPFENEQILNIVEYLVGNPTPDRKSWLEQQL